ncbi:MAG: hydratase [Ruminococcaceae bacterium]|nr:hydratase [Oscillospiraceae bacterium]
MNLIDKGYYYGGKIYATKEEVLAATGMSAENADKNTLSYRILSDHNKGTEDKLRISFDAMASHDITYVGIIQTARAGGLEKFPVPYVLTNCHNSLCAVGGTINEDDHVFGLSAAKKYGGIFVPAHIAVIHQYMRECFAAPGKMILGSDSHTRYGALGCMAIGEGGPELVKQLLCRTYDIDRPDKVAVVLSGSPRHGVGPQDVALAIIGKVFKNGFVKNKVIEFVGEGISSLSVDYRNGIDVMTTETTCLSTVWETDDKVKAYLAKHGRADEYKELKIEKPAYYDGIIDLDLSTVEPMIALPFHPANVYSIKELNANPADILRESEKSAEELFGGRVKFCLTDKLVNGKLNVQQGVIAGCAGGIYENIWAASQILKGANTGNGAFSLSVYPASQPVYFEMMRSGALKTLAECGAVIKTAFCGPCFGAGDVPANGALSIRHSTRNFPNREGSKPGEGQISSVALMDARSIAASAKMGGVLTAATDVDYDDNVPEYNYDDSAYTSRVYAGFGKADSASDLIYGPNIADWPKIEALPEDMLYKVAAYITDPVTTTDELIPSGETSSYRSNPERLSQFALSRKVPEYVGRAKEIRAAEKARLAGDDPVKTMEELAAVYAAAEKAGLGLDKATTGIASLVYANKPGDGSAREQAASCQRVLGGGANIAVEYATKRYRSNLINWGMVPFTTELAGDFACGDYILVKGIRSAIDAEDKEIKAYVIKGDSVKETTLKLPALTLDEKRIILEGCLINYYRKY